MDSEQTNSTLIVGKYSYALEPPLTWSSCRTNCGHCGSWTRSGIRASRRAMYGSVVAAMEAALVAEAAEFEGSTDTDEGTDTEVSASEAAAGSFEEESGAETVVVTDGPG